VAAEGAVRALGLAVCAGLALGVVACTDTFVESNAEQFSPGVTTRAQAIAALGPPSSIYQAVNGETTLSWARGGGLFKPGETQQYAIVFGPDDRMIRVAAKP
jgi:hypothetical protein